MKLQKLKIKKVEHATWWLRFYLDKNETIFVAWKNKANYSQTQKYILLDNNRNLFIYKDNSNLHLFKDYFNEV